MYTKLLKARLHLGDIAGDFLLSTFSLSPATRRRFFHSVYININVNSYRKIACDSSAIFLWRFFTVNEKMKTEIAPWFAIMLKEMDDTDEIIAVATSLMAVCTKSERKKRRMWAKTWLRRRDEKSAYNSIIAELRLEDKEHFRYYLRMNTEAFEVSAI